MLKSVVSHVQEFLNVVTCRDHFLLYCSDYSGWIPVRVMVLDPVLFNLPLFVLKPCCV